MKKDYTFVRTTIPFNQFSFKEKIRAILYLGFICVALWCSLTTLVYAFSNPEKTQTEVAIHIPQSFILNFK